MTNTGLIFGFIAGVAGAAAWAALAYFGGVEIGYLAWGIGVLVGVAVAAGGKTGTTSGLAAVVITILSLVGGKYATVELLLQKELAAALAENEDMAPTSFEEPSLVSRIANQIAEEREAGGETIEWPELPEEQLLNGDLDPEATFPEEIWKQASEKWSAMEATEQDAFRQKTADETKEAIVTFTATIINNLRGQAFKESFGFLDLVFFGLAVASAWGIASRDGE